MSWWNRSKSVWLLVFGGLLLVITMGVMRFIGPRMGQKFCTMVDIVADEGVVVNLVGLDLPEKYTVEVDFPSGKEAVHCDNLQNTCSHGAYFRQPESGYPPKELTVTVISNNKQASRTFTPKYEIILPNGEGCEPVYYRTEVDFSVSQ